LALPVCSPRAALLISPVSASAHPSIYGLPMHTRPSQSSFHGYAPAPQSASSPPCWEASTSSQRWCFPKASTTADSSAKSPRAHRPLQKASSSLTPSHQDRIGHPHENQPTPHGWPPWRRNQHLTSI